jgi:hypothetical protein
MTNIHKQVTKIFISALLISIVNSCSPKLKVDKIETSSTQLNKSSAEDPEFVEKERARIRAYREANRSHINELARLRRQKKKDEINLMLKNKNCCHNQNSLD